MARLILLSSGAVGAEHALVSPCIVGRGPACGIRVDEESVSREHAKLFERDGVWSVADLNSRNGTFVNGAKVTRADLRPGDELTLGRARLRFAADPPKEAVVEEIELEAASLPPLPSRPSPPAQVAAPSPAKPVAPLPLQPKETPPTAPSAPSRPVPAASARPLPSGVRRSATGAILLDHADAPGGSLGEDLAQRGLLFRTGVLAAVLVLAVGAFFAAKLAARFFAPPPQPAEKEPAEAAAPADHPATNR